MNVGESYTLEMEKLLVFFLRIVVRPLAESHYHTNYLKTIQI